MSISSKLLLTTTAAFFFFFFLISFIVPPNSEIKYLEKTEIDKRYIEERKMVIGSRPPGCENKCKNCRPCTAAVVVPDHRMKRFKAASFFTSSREEEDSYYLLSWKCQCGNKIYQP